MQRDRLWGDEPPQNGGEALRRIWQVGREAAAEKQRVTQAVRDAGRGKTRDQLRDLFEAELDRLGVPRSSANPARRPAEPAYARAVLVVVIILACRLGSELRGLSPVHTGTDPSLVWQVYRGPMG